jgi:hypothetical protein
VGQERLGPSYFFISLVLGPLNSLLWYVPSSRYGARLLFFVSARTNKRHHHHGHLHLIPDWWKSSMVSAVSCWQLSSCQTVLLLKLWQSSFLQFRPESPLSDRDGVAVKTSCRRQTGWLQAGRRQSGRRQDSGRRQATPQRAAGQTAGSGSPQFFPANTKWHDAGGKRV